MEHLWVGWWRVTSDFWTAETGREWPVQLSVGLEEKWVVIWLHSCLWWWLWGPPVSGVSWEGQVSPWEGFVEVHPVPFTIISVNKLPFTLMNTMKWCYSLIVRFGEKVGRKCVKWCIHRQEQQHITLLTEKHSLKLSWHLALVFPCTSDIFNNQCLWSSPPSEVESCPQYTSVL